MEQNHRDTLRNNRTFIIKNLHNIVDVTEGLYAKEVLTESMKEEILERSPLLKERIRTLLDILPKRGKNAFDLFCNTLDKTQNEEIADNLIPHRQKFGSSSSSRKILSRAGSIHSQPSQDEHRQAQMLPSGCGDIPKKAPMYVSKRKLMIINNINDPDASRGRDSDFTEVRTLFKDHLGFDVVNKSKKKAEEVKKLLQTEQEALMESEEYECFVLLFMSTGTPTKAYGFDDVAIDTDEIIEFFTDTNCPSLANKPKIFIFQTCPRLKKIDQYDEELHSKFKNLSIEQKWKNIYILSAVPDKAIGSWRDTDTMGPGSYFIQTLVTVFKEEKKSDFRTLVRKLEKSLARVRTKEGTVRVASVEQYDSLAGDLFFYRQDEVYSPVQTEDTEGNYVNLHSETSQPQSAQNLIGGAVGGSLCRSNTESLSVKSPVECESISTKDHIYQNLPLASGVNSTQTERHAIVTSGSSRSISIDHSQSK